ncbi:MAG: flagellar FliJ family protein [Micavibrio aeruginosavorus]|nr:flagellar FliJ family protein [Micavibrio aeruginosavorus]
MADLLSLIRLRKHRVEEKQKVLSALYREAEMFQLKKQQMEDQLERERETAKINADAAAYYGLYAENMRKKIGKVDEAIQRLNKRIEAAQEDVRAAFAEQKKVEIIQRNRDEEEEKERADKETQMLDEIAIEGFRRKEKE